MFVLCIQQKVKKFGLRNFVKEIKHPKQMSLVSKEVSVANKLLKRYFPMYKKIWDAKTFTLDQTRQHKKNNIKPSGVVQTKLVLQKSADSQERFVSYRIIPKNYYYDYLKI